MKTLLKTASIFMALLPVFASAQSSVWKVEKDDSSLYLGGTLHVLSAEDYPLPEEFDRAYAAADVLVLETDIAATMQPEFQMASMAAISYQDGRTLNSVLSKEVYAQLNDYMSSRSIPIAMLNNFTAFGVSLTITVLELQRMGITAMGVDAHFHGKALVDAKTVSFLETPQEQLDFIASIGEGIEDDIVTSTLRDLENLPDMMSELTGNWRSGDLDALDENMVAEMRTEFPDVYRILILERNNRWLQEIEKMLETASVEAVYVGSGHLGGEDGLLQQLSNMGYTVTQL